LCGLIGSSYLDLNRINVLDLVHRGPDSNSIFKKENISIGHTRLSIIGINDGAQPLISSDKRYGLVFNGEIYNYIELKEEFKEELETDSDTEVLFHLLIKNGIKKTLKKVNGMFAFAFIDYEKQEIILARDRLGQKPLFYSLDKKGIIFASEILPIYNLIGKSGLSINPVALSSFFNCFYISSPLTIWNEISSLKQGTFLKYSIRDNNVIHEQYWSPFVAERKLSPEGVLESLIDDATSLRMRSDVKLGAFLSGGVDSSLIVQSMSKQKNHIRTFVASIKDALNEERYAKIVSDKFKTDHTVLSVEKKVLSRSLLRRIVRSFGQPFADSSIVPTFLVSKEIAKNVKVAISGDGADEIFCGYNKYRSEMPLKSLFFRNENIDFIVPEMRRDTFEWMKSEMPGLEKLKKKDAINQLDIRYFLEGDILQKVDRMSMLSSLEVRSPFLDHRIVELALALKDEYVFDPSTGKKCLKDLLCKSFDKDFVYRDKIGFMLSIEEWEERIDDLLDFKNILKTGFFDDTIDKKSMTPYLKFAFLIFDIWLEEFYE
tara:strand:+ start:359 stop:1993 length:1635 start_codon:yes stop_codon:yes gene_type:complete